MKKKFIRHVTLLSKLLALCLFIGCAKEETTKVVTTSNATTQNTIALDEITLNNEFDQATDEAIQVICNHKAIIKGASVDTSQLNLNVITIYYAGKEADGSKSRSGSDSIYLIGSWGAPGATANITLGCLNSPGYEVTFISNNTSLRFDGTTKLVNLYGGYFQNVTNTDSLVVMMRGSLQYTFNDQAASAVYYPFNMKQIRSFTKPDTIIAATQGDTAIDNVQHVCSWGTNRFGNTYYTSISATIVQNISDYTLSYNPLSGMKNIEGITEPVTCTYGVNSAGNAVTSGKPYGVYVSWTNNGGAAESVVPYYY